MSTSRADLPVLSTPFIGRQKDVDSLHKLLRREDVRLVTLLGPGGVGKTRLAIRVVSDLATGLAGRIHFISLAPINDAQILLSTIAQTLGVQPTNNRSLLDELSDFLSGQQVLVLDNFEQLTPAAPQLSELLAGSPGLKILVTSRSSLHLSNEHEFPVAPLLPAEAVALFVQRAQTHKPDFDATSQNSTTITSICQHLDGLPLAIELAAARVKLLPPKAILSRLENRLTLLTGGPRDVPVRHQSLRQALDWSYNLLELGEQRLFRRLGVFAGSCSLDALDAVCNLPGELSFNPLDQAQALIDQSLLRQEEGLDGEPRLWMLETIREYALEQLTGSDELSVVRRAQARHYYQWVQQIEASLVGPQQGWWLDHLDQEHNNLRAVLRWAAESTDEADVEIGLKLAAVLGRFWTLRSHLMEGRERLAGLLALPTAFNPTLKHTRALALNAAGLLAIRRSDYVAAGELLEQALLLWGELDNANTEWRGKALALDSLGWVASAFGQFERARSLYESSLALHREHGALQDSQAADALAHLGMVEFVDGNYPRAQPLLAESLSIKRALGEKWGMGFALFHLGCIAISQGSYAEAYAHILESLALCIELNERLLRAFLLETLVWLTITWPEKNNPARGAQIFGAAEALREAISAPRPPQWKILFERILMDVKTAIGPETFAKEVQIGKGLTPDEAFVVFEKITIPSENSSSILSSRELEVLQWVAAGLSDAQIAQQLVVSVRTVHAHLQSIYNKLGVSSRTAAIHSAFEQKLITK